MSSQLTWYLWRIFTYSLNAWRLQPPHYLCKINAAWPVFVWRCVGAGVEAAEAGPQSTQCRVQSVDTTQPSWHQWQPAQGYCTQEPLAATTQESVCSEQEYCTQEHPQWNMISVMLCWLVPPVPAVTCVPPHSFRQWSSLAVFLDHHDSLVYGQYGIWMDRKALHNYPLSLVLALHHCYQREQNIQLGLGVQRETFRCWTRNLFIIHNVLDQMDV